MPPCSVVLTAAAKNQRASVICRMQRFGFGHTVRIKEPMPQRTNNVITRIAQKPINSWSGPVMHVPKTWAWLHWNVILGIQNLKVCLNKTIYQNQLGKTASSDPFPMPHQKLCRNVLFPTSCTLQKVDLLELKSQKAISVFLTSHAHFSPVSQTGNLQFSCLFKPTSSCASFS